MVQVWTLFLCSVVRVPRARITMKQLLDGEDLDIIVDRFAQMIQSGRSVTLDNEVYALLYYI